VPTPLPSPGDELLTPPDAAEVQLLAAGVTSAISSDDGLTPLQSVLLAAMFEAMTGHRPDPTTAPISPAELANGLARRNEAFRTRILQVMLLGALVLRPLPREVADQVDAFAAELSVGDGMLDVARRYAEGAYDLAAFDFDRNGYAADWSADRQAALHSSRTLEDPWAITVDDPALAARWAALEDLPPGTLGRGITELYRARGFAYPGSEGSAPPLLAQHDWVHVLADYGTTVTSELEVFGFIARANDDPRAFSLLAMVVSLFETGNLRSGAGCSRPSPASCRATAWRCASRMPCGAARWWRAASTSSASTGSSSPPSPSPRPASGSASCQSRRRRSTPARWAPGSPAASASTSSSRAAPSPSASASPTTPTAPPPEPG
jgi:hypothetical protein